jgi:hypothetical protein
MASAAGQAFIQARDPQKAQAARLAQPRPWRTATRATTPVGMQRARPPLRIRGAHAATTEREGTYL